LRLIYDEIITYSVFTVQIKNYYSIIHKIQHDLSVFLTENRISFCSEMFTSRYSSDYEEIDSTWYWLL